MLREYLSMMSSTSSRQKKPLKKAFQIQTEGKGFTFVEVLSTCPTNWGKTPIEALKWLEENMIPYYPLGNYRTPEEEKTPEEEM